MTDPRGSIRTWVRSADADADAKSKDGGDAAAPKKDPAPIAPTTPHPFAAEDLLAMDRISDPNPSPDGSRIAFVLRHTELEANKGRTDIYTVGADGGPPTRLTDDPAGDNSPRFSPDGKTIYFLSSRDEHYGIFKMSVDGGAAEPIGKLPLPVGNLVVSPRGKYLAFTVDVFTDCDNLECTKARLDEREEDKRSGQEYDRLFVRHWDTFKDGRRSHLFVVPTDGGPPRDLTSNLDADVPSKPFGGSEEFAFSPDESTVVFTARVAGNEEPWSTNFDLFAVPIGGGEAKNLTEENKAWDTQPVFSPDGKTLAYKAMKRPGYEADRFGIMVRDWPDGKPREVAPTWDRSAMSLAFTANGQRLLTVAQDVGQRSIFSVAVADGAIEEIVDAGYNGSVALMGEEIVYSHHDLRGPAELFKVPVAGGEPKALTTINAKKIEAARTGEAEQFSFKGAGGDTVYGYLVKPVDFDAAKKYPVAFVIHGGPQGSFGNMFHYRWNAQTYAGAGYGVVMIDFHGSTGYGQKFTDAIGGDWGGKPLVDLQKGLAFALEEYPWLDGDRACALGASYGGFMINWIAGNWPDGFKCLVNHDGVFDNRSMYYTTEELWFPEWEHGGPYYANPKGFEKHNPVAHVDKWKTPMLVIQGGLDYRVPPTQGIAAFTALQRRGVPSRFLYFPDENHWVLQPANSLQWHKTVLDWLAEYTAR